MKNLGASSEVSSFGKELDFMAWFIPRSLSDTNLFTQTDGLTGASSGVWTMPSKSKTSLILVLNANHFKVVMFGVLISSLFFKVSSK
jgi:hypothetical protein